ncbi:MAG: hypothetical protein VYD45_07735 [Pseudomonadota bacterium]|nr:hypothetical protein [Pseudomonadota bacterium]
MIDLPLLKSAGAEVSQKYTTTSDHPYVLWVYAVPLRRGLLSLLALVPLALIGFGPNWFGGAT